MTLKELHEWADNQDYCRVKVRSINQKLIAEGLIKEKKKPIAFYHLVSENLEETLKRVIEQARKENLAKKKKLQTKEAIL